MTRFLKKYNTWITGIILALVVFWFGQTPIQTPDAFYHVKAGEIFWQHGLIAKDVFSYTADGRMWYHYEWLFEVIIYIVQKLFGFGALSYFFATISVLQVGLLYLFLKKFFNISPISAGVFAFSYFCWNAGFLIGRPQILAFLFFMATLMLILWYVRTNKNFMLITIPITYMWANMHGTVIFGMYLFFAYALLCLLFFFKTKEKIWIAKARMLAIFGLLSTIVSILPPIGFTQYQLLLLFTQHQNTVRTFITEWAPLFQLNFFKNAVYLILLSLALIPPIFIAIKAKEKMTIIFLTPLLIFFIFPYMAVRNISFAFVIIVFFWAASFSHLRPTFTYLWQKILLMLFIPLLFFINIAIFTNQGQQDIPWYQTKVTDFLLSHPINGNMFNNFDSGFYLLYRLYPRYKVFVDGRLDVYLCCEVKSYQTYLQNIMLAPDKEKYTFFTKNFIDKYHQSFIVILTRMDYYDARLMKWLSDDPSWEPVFWDDAGIIFVRNDGKNTKLLKDFGSTVASPYNVTPVRNNNLDQALKEYKRMISIADSARSRNALGYIYLKQKKIDLAQSEFEKATALNAGFDSPYLNLGEIALSHGNTQLAVTLYQQAKHINPTRAYIYLRLAQLYRQYLYDPSSAQQVLREGLQNAQGEVDKEALQKALDSIQL